MKNLLSLLKNMKKFSPSRNTMKHFLVLKYFTGIVNGTQHGNVTYKVQKHLQCHWQGVLGQSLPLNLVYLFSEGLRIVASLLSVTSKSHTLSGPLSYTKSFSKFCFDVYNFSYSLYNKTFKEPEDKNIVSAGFHEQ